MFYKKIDENSYNSITRERKCSLKNTRKTEKYKKLKKTLAFSWKMLYYNRARFVGQAVKTSPSHGENRGSIPLRTARKICGSVHRFFLLSEKK